MNFLTSCFVPFLSLILIACVPSSDNSSTSTEGASAGSTAAMTFYNGYFITLDGPRIRTYKLTENSVLVGVNEQSVQGAETLFTYRDNELYVGTETGVRIFTLEDNGYMTYQASASHTRSCDPVIVDGNTMYITLRSNINCRAQQGLSELVIYELTNDLQPSFLSSLPMTNPYGLAMGAEYLWVCDEDGLTKIDTSNLTAPNIVEKYTDIQCTDIIIRSHDKAILTGDHGIYLADLSEQHPVVLSNIAQGD